MTDYGIKLLLSLTLCQRGRLVRFARLSCNIAVTRYFVVVPETAIVHASGLMK